MSEIIFIIRRFFRIYPTFIIVFIFGTLTVYRFQPSENILRGMFFIHRDYSLLSPGFGYNVLGPAWTLTYEIYFYFIFMLAMFFTHRYRTVLASIFLLIPVVILQIYFNGELSISGGAAAHVPADNPAFGMLRFISSPVIAEFVVGMIFYELFRRFQFTIKKEIATFIFFVCTGLFISFYFSRNLTGFGLDRAGLISAILLFGFLTYDKDD
jgi:exopolysaccharide production protein ExoZ